MERSSVLERSFLSSIGGNKMKKIENIDNCLTYSYQDKNNEIITCKIANYAIQGLFVIKLITSTKNTYKIIEKLAL